MDEHKLIEERNRAHLAQVILDNPIWQEAWKGIEDALREHLESPQTSDEAALVARNSLILMRRVKGYIVETMETGDLANIELERSKDGYRAGPAA